MKLVKVQDLFDVIYGVNLDLNKLEETTSKDPQSIRYVARSEKNNGITAFVKKIDDYTPNPAMTISVAGGGTVMSSFLQEEEYYSGRDLFYLKPKVKMTKQIMLYYCVALYKNKFKYSYGRQANKTLKDLLIPAISEIPKEVKEFNIEEEGLEELETLIEEVKNIGESIINFSNELVDLEDLFEVHNGLASSKVIVQPKRVQSNLIPYVRPSKWQSTSYAGFVNKNDIPIKYIFPKNTLYVSTDGAGSHTYTYLSIEEFVPNSNVAVLIPRINMSIAEKLAYATFITKNRYKFSYGRKPKSFKLKKLKLPKSF